MGFITEAKLRTQGAYIWEKAKYARPRSAAWGVMYAQ